MLKIEERTQDTLTYLPAVSEIEIDATGVDVHDGEYKQVGAHTEVGKGEVAHEELGHGKLQHVTEQHEKNGQVAYHSRDDDKPHTDTQPREAHDILTRVQRVGFWSAHDKDRAARNTWNSVLQGMNPQPMDTQAANWIWLPTQPRHYTTREKIPLSRQLLKMGTKWPETCWATYKEK